MKRFALVLIVSATLVAWTGGWGRVAGLVAQRAPGGQLAVTEAKPGEQTVQITESQLSQQLTHQLVGQPLGTTPLGPATLTRISAHLSDGHVEADGDARVASASVPVSLSANGTARDGRAVVLVDDLRAGGVPLPPTARDSVQRALQAQVDEQVDRLQLRVTSIAIGDGKLTLVGSPR